MNTVQKNNTITKKQVQEILEKNQGKLRISDKNLKKLVKSMRSNTISRQMRKVFYQECLKKIERNEEEQKGKFKHLTPEDRISIEILHTAGFNNSFIGAFVGKDRSSIKREIDKLDCYALGRELTKEDIDKLIPNKSEDDIAFTVRLNDIPASVQLLRLTAPSPISSSGIRFADAEVEADGSFQLNMREKYQPQNEYVKVSVPAMSAAVMIIDKE